MSLPSHLHTKIGGHIYLGKEPNFERDDNNSEIAKLDGKHLGNAILDDLLILLSLNENENQQEKIKNQLANAILNNNIKKQLPEALKFNRYKSNNFDLPLIKGGIKPFIFTYIIHLSKTDSANLTLYRDEEIQNIIRNTMIKDGRLSLKDNYPLLHAYIQKIQEGLQQIIDQ